MLHDVRYDRSHIIVELLVIVWVVWVVCVYIRHLLCERLGYIFSCGIRDSFVHAAISKDLCLAWGVPFGSLPHKGCALRGGGCTLDVLRVLGAVSTPNGTF